MVFVDSNVFVLALRYPREFDAGVNSRSLGALRSRGDGVTSVVNVHEICGILSINLSRLQLLPVVAHFARRFGETVVPAGEPASVVQTTATEVLAYMSRRMSFGDALVAHAVDTWARDAEAFVTWDARHFQGKTTPTVLTPADFAAEEHRRRQ